MISSCKAVLCYTSRFVQSSWPAGPVLEETSIGSLPSSKPPKRMDSAVPIKSVTTGRPSSGFSNLCCAWNGVQLFFCLNNKPEISGRKAVMGSLTVSFSIDGSISLPLHDIMEKNMGLFRNMCSYMFPGDSNNCKRHILLITYFLQVSQKSSFL